ncbi:hypothetical protein GOODEAATRI_022279 [Goodea atripinnis]|uniref:Uncharacterized protein n=1 Tax=Goodea atripinnis TaxID=208336 RepID=A0ABV0N3I9_9TELE
MCSTKKGSSAADVPKLATATANARGWTAATADEDGSVPATADEEDPTAAAAGGWRRQRRRCVEEVTGAGGKAEVRFWPGNQAWRSLRQSGPIKHLFHLLQQQGGRQDLNLFPIHPPQFLLLLLYPIVEARSSVCSVQCVAGSYCQGVRLGWTEMQTNLWKQHCVR